MSDPQPLRVIVCGGRDFNDYALVKQKLDNILAGRPAIIISGCANGADKLGERYAFEHALAVERYPADWKNHGKAAGPIRNKLMAGLATHCVAFWDGKSPGTADMIKKAKKAGLITRTILYT